MRILVLWADDRSPNLGVRVLGAGTKALAQRIWPEAEFVFYNYGSGTAPTRLGSFKRLVREAVTGREGLADWFKGFDLVLDTRSGDSFADIYGLSRLVAMSGATELAVRAGVPVVLTPQTIGPFGTRRARLVARRSLHTAELVMARDPISARASAGLGRTVDTVTTDVVFALQQPQPTRTYDVVLNVSGLLWHDGPHVDASAYRRTVGGVYDALVASGRTVSLLPHVLSSTGPDDDVPAIQEFHATHAVDAEVLAPESLEDVRAVVAGADLVIGSRMHACLNALSVGTPAIPLAYSRKFAPLMADLGWSHVLDLRDDSVDVPAEVLALSERDDLRGEVEIVVSDASISLDKATTTLQQIRELVGTA